MASFGFGKFCGFAIPAVSVMMTPMAFVGQSRLSFWRVEWRPTLGLAIPIVLAQLSHMAMGVVDSLVAGRIGTTTLAGVGLGTTWFWNGMVFFIGVLMAFDTFFAQAVGAKDESAVRHYFRQGLWLTSFLCVLAVGFVLAGWLAYGAWGHPDSFREVVLNYMIYAVWSVPAIFFFFFLQRFWQAKGVVMPFVVFTVIANGTNLLTDLALGLGWWGFPRMEERGLALATVLNRFFMLILAVAYTVWKGQLTWNDWVRPWWRAQWEMLRLGLPAGGQTALEVSVFLIATILAAGLGSVALATHHVCLQIASVTWMFCFGISSACAVRVGWWIGARRFWEATQCGWLCLCLSLFVMIIFAWCYWMFGGVLMGWFTQDPDVIALGKRVFLIIAAFQIADGAQVTITGALRGVGNTMSAMVANLIGHYPVGLVLSLVLGFSYSGGLIGIWTGLAAGLIVVALILVVKWKMKCREIMMTSIG